MPHDDSGDVGDRVERARFTVKRHAEITSPWLGLGRFAPIFRECEM
jgi:hypothetical protein